MANHGTTLAQRPSEPFGQRTLGGLDWGVDALASEGEREAQASRAIGQAILLEGSWIWVWVEVEPTSREP